MSLATWLPRPLFSLVLLLIWLLLFNSIAPGVILLGILLSLFIPWLTADFWPERIHFRFSLAVVKFLAAVLVDILVANLVVAALILNPWRTLRPRFIKLPLTLQDPFAITLLTSTISLTPGTVSADLSPNRRTLLIHCLNLDDETALIEHIKRRYETPLQEIFEPC
jgi:multicomponent K+:H+ antiporter subunit E